MPADEEVVKKVEVNKWDSQAVKNAVDDAVKRVIEEKHNYREQFHLVDYRLLISTIAVGFSGFALLWDWLHPFPNSRPILILCVLSYFALMGVLQLYTWYVEAGFFYIAVDEDPTGKSPNITWVCSSSLKRFDHMYKLKMEVKEGKQTTATGSLEKSIAMWIDDNGEVVLDLVSADILKLHDSLKIEKKRN